MKRTLIFTALALAGGLALARDETGGEARRAEWRAQAEARFAEADKDGDGRLDKVEAQAAFGDRFVARFDRMDGDGDGELTPDEMRRAHRGLRHGHRRMAYSAGLWRGMDDDGDGLISRAELGDKMPRLAEDFAAIDSDRDGKLSRGEVRAWRKAGHERRGTGDEG
ncbi:EF-hand domain-containing protein [Arenimonas fontis]|uniref:EF-hand domain-containing protein n=1 Tax=Arenimonas fontis TaxID=2608255 RepID=A0A5B2ZBX5_9GAMM|nr:EF-hand domain-containing protein [Arenimonas fontis]KAA2285043.1 hypothetical protein F0415_07315 [Arenimonas fontis]